MSDERGTAGRSAIAGLRDSVERGEYGGYEWGTFYVERLHDVLDEIDVLAAAGDAMDRAIVEALTNGPTARARLAAALGAWRAARGGLGR